MGGLLTCAEKRVALRGRRTFGGQPAYTQVIGPISVAGKNIDDGREKRLRWVCERPGQGYFTDTPLRR